MAAVEDLPANLAPLQPLTYSSEVRTTISADAGDAMAVLAAFGMKDNGPLCRTIVSGMCNRPHSEEE